MNSNATSGNCQRNCWLAALVVGVLMAWYLMSAGWGFFLTLIIALVIFVAAGRLMTRSFCSDKAAQGGQTASAPATPPAPTPAPVVEAAPEPASEPSPEPEPTPEPEAEPDAAPVPAARSAQASSDVALLKPSTVLPGQDELASRKGTWRYGGDPAPAPAPAPETPATTPAQAASEQPAGLAQARDGGADNLKLIKGVGPKLERVLNGMGYYHFDQIAGWTTADIEWVDNNLVGFRGRVSRDGWVEQAKALAAGEETEFAKRAKRDKIYD